MKASRQEKFPRMKQLSRGEALNWILFPDETIFSVQPVWNSQNNRELLPKGSSQNVRVEITHFPKSIMAWVRFVGLGKTKVVFLPKGAKLHAKVDRKPILEGAFFPWAEGHAKNIHWWLQQEWTPTDGEKKTLQWCEANVPGFWSKDI
ncbi:hypothetical protein MTO96_015023 [Rhipicephalus appendiculatus]